MRLCSLVIVSAFILTACGSGFTATEITRKPKMPAKASVLEYRNAAIQNLDVEDMEMLLNEIDKDLNRPNITEQDIRRGWYYGLETDMKYGTPTSWIWVNDSKESRWISPNIIEESDYEEEKILCDETAGKYIVSCIDTEVSDCEYIPETECRCIESSIWVDRQGCILTDEEGELVSVSQNELSQGWYLGLPNEKKLNTPSAWIWAEAGKDSRWQNPYPK